MFFEPVTNLNKARFGEKATNKHLGIVGLFLVESICKFQTYDLNI